MKKKVISFVLTILMVVGLFSGLTFSANAKASKSGKFGPNAKYSYSNSVLTVSGTGPIKNYGCGDSPVAYATNVKKIVVEPGITSLGEGCFYCCENVTAVSLPNTLTDIRFAAFSECNSLTEITIPNSVTNIESMNLTDCDNMETIYYMGTEEEFSKIDFDEDWSDLNIIYHSHKYKTTAVTKATLKNNGKTVKKCAGCGKTVSTVIYYPKTISLANTIYYYNGKVKSPGVTVKDSKGKTLRKGTDYSVSYSGKRKSVGEYSVTVNFKGNYSGEKTLKFKVLPKIAFDSAALCVKQTKKINAKSSHKVTYKSSNSKVASVDKKGVITAKKKGKATITVTSNKISTKIKINVSNPYVKLSKTNLSVFKGKSETLTATVCPAGAKVTWSSADKKIAKVSSKGKVTGVEDGETTIKATIKYKGETYQKTCKITVKKPKATSITYDDIEEEDGEIEEEAENTEEAKAKITSEIAAKRQEIGVNNSKISAKYSEISFLQSQITLKQNEYNNAVSQINYYTPLLNAAIADVNYYSNNKQRVYVAGIGFTYRTNTTALSQARDRRNNYQSQITNYTVVKANAEASINEANRKINTLKTEIADLNRKNETLQNEITALESK